MARLQPGCAAGGGARAAAQLLARCRQPRACPLYPAADRARPRTTHTQRARRFRGAPPLPRRRPARVAGRRRNDHRRHRRRMRARAARGGRAADRRADPGSRAMSDANRSDLQQRDAREKRSDWEARQRASGPPRAPEPSVIEWLELLPLGLALDVAAGTGRHSVALARAGFTVVAIDYAEAALRSLQSIARAEQLSVWPLAA